MLPTNKNRFKPNNRSLSPSRHANKQDCSTKTATTNGEEFGGSASGGQEQELGGNKPPNCCTIINCVMCGFGCATCCCLREMICRKMVFAPPSPPFYEFRGKEMWRIPLEVYDTGSEFTRDQFTKMETKLLDLKVYKIQTSRKKTIATMFLKHPKPKATILFSHGNAGDIGIMSFHLQLMAETLQVNVYAYEYTGYGESSNPGKPTPTDIFTDAEAAYAHLTENLGISPNHIILYGQSLGSGPSIHLGRLHKVSGVVIHSGLMSAVRVINPFITRTPWYDVFKNIDNIQKCLSPVYIIHGDADDIVPVFHGIQLYNNAPVKIKPWIVAGGGHNDIELEYEQEYFLRLKWAIQDFSKISKSKESKISPITSQPIASDTATRSLQEKSNTNNKHTGCLEIDVECSACASHTHTMNIKYEPPSANLSPKSRSMSVASNTRNASDTNLMVMERKDDNLSRKLSVSNTKRSVREVEIAV